MSVAELTEEPSTAVPGSEKTLIVDCDFHPLIRDISQLRKRMSARAAGVAFGESLQTKARDPNRSPHPTSGLRLDANPPKGGPPGSDPEFANEQWMDRYDVSAAVLIPVQAGVVVPWGAEEVADEFLSAMNDHFLEDWTGYDSRYRVGISVSPYDGASAVREIERLATVDGVAGVFMPDGGVGMGRRQFFDVYRAAAQYKMPIMHHVSGAEGNFASAPTLAGGLPNTYPERHSLLAQPGVALLSSMLFAGVFEEVPDLQLVMVEYGFSWLPSYLARVDEAWEMGGRQLPKPPSEYVNRNVKFMTQPIDEPADQQHLWQMLEMFDSGNMLMFSSDYPHWDQDDPRVVLSSRIPGRLRSSVASGTALTCFGSRLGL